MDVIKNIKELYKFYDSSNDLHKDSDHFTYCGIRYQANKKFYDRRSFVVFMIKIVIVISVVLLFKYGKISDYNLLGVPLFLIATIGGALVIRAIGRHYLFKMLVPIENEQ